MSVIGRATLTFGHNGYCQEVEGLGDLEELVGARRARALGYNGGKLAELVSIKATIKEIPVEFIEQNIYSYEVQATDSKDDKHGLKERALGSIPSTYTCRVKVELRFGKKLVVREIEVQGGRGPTSVALERKHIERYSCNYQYRIGDLNWEQKGLEFKVVNNKCYKRIDHVKFKLYF